MEVEPRGKAGALEIVRHFHLPLRDVWRGAFPLAWVEEVSMKRPLAAT